MAREKIHSIVVDDDDDDKGSVNTDEVGKCSSLHYGLVQVYGY